MDEAKNAVAKGVKSRSAFGPELPGDLRGKDAGSHIDQCEGND